MPQRIEMLGENLARALVAQFDRADRLLRALFADQDGGHGVGNVFHDFRKTRQKREDHAVDARLEKRLEIIPLQLRLAKRVANDHAIAAGVRIAFHRLHQLRVKRVVQRRRKEQQNTRARGRRALLSLWQRVTQILCRLHDALLGLLVKKHLVAFVEDERDRGLRHARAGGDILRCDFFHAIITLHTLKCKLIIPNKLYRILRKMSNAFWIKLRFLSRLIVFLRNCDKKNGKILLVRSIK